MSPTILFFLLKLMYNVNFITNKFSPSKFYEYLANFYINKSMWKFLKLLIYKDGGLLTNNITYSYIYKNIVFYTNFIKPHSLKYTKKNNLINNMAFLPIRIIKLSFQKKLLNKLVMVLILNIQNTNPTYLNYMNIKHSFFYLPKNVNFFYFFNFFYFKIHNY